MKRAYQYDDADRLIPLLRSVQREIRERADAIRRLKSRLDRFPRKLRGSPDHLALQAELASHMFETRLAKKELERLGCALDEAHPHRILIPGQSGELADGFTWSFGDNRVQALVAEQLP